MPYLLDTNICSYVLKKKPGSVYSRLVKTKPSDLYVSVITVYELLTGCEKSEQRDRLLPEIKSFLRPFSLLTFKEQHAYRAASLRAHLEKAGTPIGAYDLLLAAQALTDGLTFVTNNTREFRRVKHLSLEDWSR
ncbi:type II toxin-antitoxin system VapC family toxin [bacterium]|nr:type II toxin-antitoxin system VapC family toxin [bacterium]MCI0602345.1 type II toxin-antitoxin system VapC family toxin [bacterium]